MAFNGSGLFSLTFRDALDTSQITIDLLLTTHKLALFNDTITQPNFDTNTAYAVAPFNANEVTDTNWPSGGRLLSTAASGGTSVVPTWDVGAAGQLKYDHTNDVSVASTTIVSAMGVLLHADAQTTPVAKPAIVLVDFLTAASTSNGTFGIQWDALGIFTIDLVP